MTRKQIRSGTVCDTYDFVPAFAAAAAAAASSAICITRETEPAAGTLGGVRVRVRLRVRARVRLRLRLSPVMSRSTVLRESRVGDRAPLGGLRHLGERQGWG